MTFFTKNPGYEVDKLKLTALEGKTLRDAALDAQADVTTAEAALPKIGDRWEKAYAPLTASMRSLVKNLEGKLGKLDPRWKDFGLNMPGMRSTPGRVQNVTASVDETGAMVLQCDAEPLATRYRWRGRILGVQTGYTLLTSTKAPLAVVPAVEAGEAMEIIVQAVNGASQGVASEPIIFTPPVAKVAGFTNLTATEDSPVASESATAHRDRGGRVARAV